MSDRQNTCERCKWSDPRDRRHSFETQLYSCCKNAPRARIPYGTPGDERLTDRWPEVVGEEFCGEFEPKDGGAK
jgi:hypothetical protein